MQIEELVGWVRTEDARGVRALTRGCGACRGFVRRLRRATSPAIRWDDVPDELAHRFARRLHAELFLY